MNRRGFLAGLLAAPVVIRTPGLLMPVKALPLPKAHVYAWDSDIALGDVIDVGGICYEVAAIGASGAKPSNSGLWYMPRMVDVA